MSDSTPNLDCPTAKPPRRRLWIPLSLKVVAALVVVCTASAVWLGVAIRRQQAARLVFEEADAFVVSESPAQTWLRTFRGWEFMDHWEEIREIHADLPKLTDKELGSLRGITSLETLLVDSDRVTDTGLSVLRGLPQLTHLGINSPCVTDQGLAHISGCSALKNLGLNETRTTDSGLRHLARLSNLTHLALDDTLITDDGLVALQNLRELEFVSLRSTRIAGPGLRYLGDLPRLAEVHLDGTPIMGQFVAAIEARHARLVQAMLKSYPVLTRARENSMPILHHAVGDPNVERSIVALLIDFGAEVNRPDGWQRSALEWAIQCWSRYDDRRADHPRQEIIHLLLERGAVYTLSAAIDLDDAARVRSLVLADTAGPKDLTCITQAVEGGRPRSLRVLLEEGGFDAKTSQFPGVPLLYFAVEHPAIVAALLEFGADPNDRITSYNGIKGDTVPLAIAAEAGVVESVKLLLAAGADVNVRDANGKTPLSRLVGYPAAKNRDEIVKLLVKAGGRE